MATTINADTSSGLILTSDTSGIVQIQSGGTTRATINSTGISGDGSQVTALNAAAVTSGTLPMARLSGTLPALNGSALTALAAGNIATGTLPMARLSGTLPALNGSALTDLPAAAKLSTASGSAPSYSARAWANLDTNGTVSVRGSGNVSSLTDNGEGDFTVNFATAMPDDNYSVSLCSGRVESVVTGNGSNDTTRPDWSASSCRIRSTTPGGSSRDQIEITIAIFR